MAIARKRDSSASNAIASFLVLRIRTSNKAEVPQVTTMKASSPSAKTA
jgi:hypothetical protein